MNIKLDRIPSGMTLTFNGEIWVAMIEVQIGNKKEKLTQEEYDRYLKMKAFW